MRKTIPEEVHIYCDRCGKRCTYDNHKRGTVLKLDRGERDTMHDYHNFTKTYDLCDECSDGIVDFLKGNK